MATDSEEMQAQCSKDTEAQHCLHGAEFIDDALLRHCLLFGGHDFLRCQPVRVPASLM